MKKLNLIYNCIILKNKEYAIISSCFTGIGTAIKIQHLLSESLIGIVDVKIIPYDYDSLVSMGDKEPVLKCMM